MRKTKTKLLSIMLIILTLFSVFQGVVIGATQISSANLVTIQETEYHLQYWNGSQWSYVICDYVGYYENGTMYPAYCMNREYGGVPEYGSYTVSIEELVSDVRVWRTVINGFPYKTPSELGVANELDAYTATKHAIYSILYDRDVRSFYQGGDTRGEQIVNAIETMVNIGRYGTQTPQSANVTINNVGSFVEEGEYYSQTFSVTSAVSMSEYTITSTSNMPSRWIYSRYK